MLYTLKNSQLTVTLSDLGAELVSVRCAGDCEYIWQGDPTYWAGHAPLLFPICGRLFDGRYTWEGKDYAMSIHGFARRSVFACEPVGDDGLRFTLCSSEQTRQVYPFDFAMTVEYHLSGKELSSQITFRNTGDTLLPAAIGLHPGFNVPLDSGSFEDWYLEFSDPCSPDRLLFSDTCFMTGKKEAFLLENGKRLPLRHDLFDNDAIFLSRVGEEISLRSDKSDRHVTFRFPGFPYLGFWHAPRTEAPYVCIEPWCGLPSFDGEVDDFGKKCDMFRLCPGDEKTVAYSIVFN